MQVWFATSRTRLNPFEANPTKCSNTLKQIVGELPTNCLSVFDHFVGLTLKWLISSAKNSLSKRLERLLQILGDRKISKLSGDSLVPNLSPRNESYESLALAIKNQGKTRYEFSGLVQFCLIFVLFLFLFTCYEIFCTKLFVRKAKYLGNVRMLECRISLFLVLKAHSKVWDNFW